MDQSKNPNIELEGPSPVTTSCQLPDSDWTVFVTKPGGQKRKNLKLIQSFDGRGKLQTQVMCVHSNSDMIASAIKVHFGQTQK